MKSTDVKDRESYFRLVDQVEEWVKVRNALIDRLFEKGLISDFERLEMKAQICGQAFGDSKLLCPARGHANFRSNEEWEEIRERIAMAAGLKIVIAKSCVYPNDPRFDPMVTGDIYYLYSNCYTDLEELWRDEDPAGKTFQIGVLLKKGKDEVRIPYELYVGEAERCIDKEDGEPCLKFTGEGKIPGYHGKIILRVRCINGKLYSSGYQKWYLSLDREMELEECLFVALMECEDFTEEELENGDELERQGKIVPLAWVTNDVERWTGDRNLAFISQVLGRQVK